MSADLLESPKQENSKSAPESAIGSALRNRGAVSRALGPQRLCGGAEGGRADEIS